MDTTYDDRGRDPDNRLPSEGHYHDAEAAERRRVWMIVGFVALGLILAVAIALLAARNRVQAVEVQRRNIVAWASLDGRAVAPPNRHAVINCHCDAPVARVFVTPGATVRKGDVLVELSHTSSQAAYSSARQELAAAREAYRGARDLYAADLRAAQRDLAAVMESPEGTTAPPVQVPTGVTEEVAPATPEEPTASPSVTRPGNLAEPASNPAVEEAVARVADAQRRMQEYLVPYRQRLAAAQQAMQEAEEGRSAAFIRAPIAGTVIEVNAQPGEPISAVPNTLIATITDLGALKIHAPLTAEQRAAVSPGMPVQVQVEQLPDQTFSGTIESVTAQLVTPVAGQERQLQPVAIVNFVNTQGLVKPNMATKVIVQTAEVPAAISVPNDAIERDESTGQPMVRVRQGGRWVETPVQLGPSDGQYTAILSGLQEGQQVQVRRS
ncbi:MAG: efflux RND transporter periplasmic adaptor subunit [Armatimonadota bacterium]